jgi:ribA/ribD-fused uncharacterized protein
MNGTNIMDWEARKLYSNKDDVIAFYSTKGEYGWGSNFYRCPIFLDGEHWTTSEHYYQASKAVNQEDRDMIRKAESPKEAARLGREAIVISSVWDKIKLNVMIRVVYQKFKQNPDLRQKLLATGDKDIVEWTEGTPLADSVWGNACDKDGQPGLNYLGKVLMYVRECFRKEAEAKLEI